MTAASSEYVVDFPTLGDLADAWIEHHCRVPDGFTRGKPFELADWQFWIVANHYRIRDDATFDPDDPPRNQAFFYRRSQIIAPQKTGKGPLAAAMTAFEAVGPSQFCGWADEGDVYSCADHGCPCGWEYAYLPGEPMGERHPSPLIQLTATSEDQVDNVYRPLRAMIALGPLGELLAVREGFIRVLGRDNGPDFDRIDTVTSSAQSKLGNPISFAVQDETGLWTDSNKLRRVAETQRRGAAGMGGRTIETTNPWDPAENSVAQRTYESTAPDVFKFYRIPPANLSYQNKRERRKIHEFVYAGSWWVNLDSIEAEAFELMQTDPAQAERFFGNRVVAGLGSWLAEGLYESRALVTPRELAPGSLLAAGFDGSDVDDWTGIRLSTEDGYRFTPTYGPDRRPTAWNPAEWGGQIPRPEVHAAWDELAARYRLVRAYCDPPGWQTEIGSWAERWGDDVFIEWATYRVVPMHSALDRVHADLVSGYSSHDGCPLTTQHYKNARRLARPGMRYILGKPTQHQKIDLAMTDVLAAEAAADARAAGLFEPPAAEYTYVF
jgi:hypothetical protein